MSMYVRKENEQNYNWISFVENYFCPSHPAIPLPTPLPFPTFIRWPWLSCNSWSNSLSSLLLSLQHIASLIRLLKKVHRIWLKMTMMRMLRRGGRPRTHTHTHPWIHSKGRPQPFLSASANAEWWRVRLCDDGIIDLVLSLSHLSPSTMVLLLLWWCTFTQDSQGEPARLPWGLNDVVDPLLPFVKRGVVQWYTKLFELSFMLWFWHFLLGLVFYCDISYFNIFILLLIPGIFCNINKSIQITTSLFANYRRIW